ncbi:MAG: DUF1566 domain-containing protein [Candidatus Scalindua sp.]|nr:DUF1566 domain-containing protein [Candidatus Scalindua sp.]MCR4343852.1 DUF1566 domain-containing protein [Candidatus Scalindua sp.]
MKRFILAVFIVSMVFAVFGCGKKSRLEGKVVDGKGNPVANGKIIAKQVQPIKGYEHFETTIGADGTFRFKKLYPTSEYILFPWFENWAEAPMRTMRYEANKLTASFNKEGWVTEHKLKVQSGPEGETLMLKTPLVIQSTISAVAGKVVNGKNKPLEGIKIIAKQKHTVPGYEQFEATTGSDGTFRFGKLFPHSKYILIPSSKAWKTNVKKSVTTKGEQTVLEDVLTIRFTLAKGVVTDSETNLMWAAKDNGSNINWSNARAYCENYKGGGYTDWRQPTTNELAGLYKAGIRYERGYIINITAGHSWTSEQHRNSDVALFSFGNGGREWYSQSLSGSARVLPVRSGKH